MPELGLVEYGAGNIQSLINALTHVGADVRLVRRASDLEDLSHLVLPGVGAFGFCAGRLKAAGLVPAIEEWALERRRPILGVCVGMQLLAESSNELGEHAGLGWIGGRVTRLEPSDSINIPHVGWNNVRFEEAFGDYETGDEADFYFDHSYAYFEPTKGRVLATCDHGQVFAAGVRRDNIVGVQFHPEKSQRAGLRFLRSFLAM